MQSSHATQQVGSNWGAAQLLAACGGHDWCRQGASLRACGGMQQPAAPGAVHARQPTVLLLSLPACPAACLPAWGAATANKLYDECDGMELMKSEGGRESLLEVVGKEGNVRGGAGT